MLCRAVLPNAGLGNKLFPWARCRLYALEHDIPMLAPVWTQLKLGPLLRGDRDRRMYHNLFRFTPPGYVSLVGGSWRRLVDRHQVVFEGPGDHFATFTAKHDVLRRELQQLTRVRWRIRAEVVGPVQIGVHVRRGDFVEARQPEDYVMRGAIRTPLEWYAQTIEMIRQTTGPDLPAVVVSDAEDRELAELLRLKGVRRVDTGSAIGDLLVLSTAQVLVGSGGSSFSAWAAYLGQMPAIAYPGQSLSWFKIHPTRGQFIGDWNPASGTPLRELRRQVFV